MDMENLKGIIVAVFLIIVIIAGGIFLYNKSINNNTSNNQPTPTQQTQPTTQTGTQVITLTAGGFSPSTLTVKAGTTVRWVNKSGQLGQVDSDPHPTHTSYPPMNFEAFSDGSSVELVFNKPGTYHYHNHLNPSQTGTVVVE